ncbi:MAG TPA: hypothetical protein P5048_00810 [Chlamydiales bacterium]|nr:hypothetical protein [Chlamydiales bacterium]
MSSIPSSAPLPEQHSVVTVSYAEDFLKGRLREDNQNWKEQAYKTGIAVQDAFQTLEKILK